MQSKSKLNLNINSWLGWGILLVSGLLFSMQSLPIYAWVIFGIIVAIYSASQLSVQKLFKVLMSEMNSLESAKLGQAVDESTEVGKRQSVITKLSQAGKSIPSGAFREILSARQASSQVSNGAYAVVLLGLLGTFIGLAEVVSDAGLISGDAAQNIEKLIPNIFNNMRGIFGTTLCGLAASFLLRRNEELLESTQLEFFADLEEYTQFELLPELEPSSDNPVADGMLKLSSSLTSLKDSFATDLLTPLRTLLSEQQVSLGDTLKQELKAGQEVLLEQNKMVIESLQSQFKQDAKSLTESRENLFDHLSKSMEGLTQQLLKQSEYGQESIDKAQQGQSQLISDLSSKLNSKLDQVQEFETQRQGQLSQQLEQLDLKHQSFMDDFKSRGEQWIESLQDFSTELSEGMKKLNQEGLENLSQNFQNLSAAAEAGLESTTTMSSEVQSRLQEMMSGMTSITDSVATSTEYMKVNQVEMQATLEMFNHGVELLVESHSAQGEDVEEENFSQKLETTLEVFHQKATESLIENSVRTQEILLELLQQSNESRS